MLGAGEMGGENLMTGFSGDTNGEMDGIGGVGEFHVSLKMEVTSSQ